VSPVKVARTAAIRAHQRGHDRLSAEPQQAERERNGAADLRGQLHVVESGSEPGEPGLGARPEGEPCLVPPDQHVLQPEGGAHDAKTGHVEQSLGFRRGWTEAFPQFIPQPINFAG